MKTDNEALCTFLKELMRRRKLLPSQLAVDLGISHTTVSRWISGNDAPDTRSCARLATYASVPLERVLAVAGHLPLLPDMGPPELPEFREYARTKYPQELDDDLISMVEDLIERRRKRHESIT